MADSETQADRKRGGASVPLLAVATLVGILVGGGAGAFAAGPLLAKRVVASMDLVEAGAAASASPGGAPSAEAAVSGAVHRVENLLVNPAQTGGSRLLMLTAALEVDDQAGVDRLVERDAQVRDAIMGVLARKNVVELVDMQGRDDIRGEITAAIDSVMGSPTVRGIFFPVYVLQ